MAAGVRSASYVRRRVGFYVVGADDRTQDRAEYVSRVARRVCESLA
jgi:hypothetical protein